MRSLAADCPEMAYLLRAFVRYNDELYRRGGDYDDVQVASHGALPVMQQTFWAARREPPLRSMELGRAISR
ncbi:MAG: hypothetical protein H0T53_03775 [Herpetosiphonaceae bacterium]|nr:hypothetical protein [Herpetosiphonaceae bacterium]